MGMGRVNLAKKLEELQRLQQAFRDARKLVERDVGRKVVEMYLQGAGEKEIFQAVRHIVDEVYGYRKFLELRRPALQTQEKKTRKEVKKSGSKDFNTKEVLNSDSPGTDRPDESSDF